MNVHILNDLHIEFEDFTPPGTDADVLVLAGDIGVGAGALPQADILCAGALESGMFYKNSRTIVV